MMQVAALLESAGGGIPEDPAVPPPTTVLAPAVETYHQAAQDFVSAYERNAAALQRYVPRAP
jgi:hypothetical protein